MIVVDVETTGLDWNKNSIVSIGAIDFENPSNTFYSENKFPEGTEITSGALKVNGFSLEEISPESGKKTLKESLEEFIKWLEPIKDKTIAGHNVLFDQRFLDAGIRKYKINYVLGHRTIDMHTIAYNMLKSLGEEIPSYKGFSALGTDQIYSPVGLPPEPKPHNALNGAKWEAEALSRLIHGKPLLEEFKHYPIPEKVKYKRYED